MERGLFWLPLLGLFMWLAWAGWNEYQKLEAYKVWAAKFERAKFDIYAVLGQNGQVLTWGKPTRNEPVNLQSLCLLDVRSICLFVDNREYDLEQPPDQGRNVALEFLLTSDQVMRIPFTEIPLAVQWGKHLQQELSKG